MQRFRYYEVTFNDGHPPELVVAHSRNEAYGLFEHSATVTSVDPREVRDIITHLPLNHLVAMILMSPHQVVEDQLPDLRR